MCTNIYIYIYTHLYTTCTKSDIPTYLCGNIVMYISLFRRRKEKRVHGQRSGDHGFSLLPLSSPCYPCISPGAFGIGFCGKQDVSKGSNERIFAKIIL